MTKNIILTLSLTLSTLLIGCGPSGETQSTQEMSPAPSTEVQTNIRNVSAIEAAALLSENEAVQVLDIRTPAEFAAGHIDGAMMVDFKSSNFKTELAKLDRSTPYIVHCRSGGRSGKSLAAFKALGFENIIHMNKGMNDWMNSQLPVVQ